MSSCPKCGFIASSDSDICLNCGSPLNTEDTPSPSTDRDLSFVSDNGQEVDPASFFRSATSLDGNTNHGQSQTGESQRTQGGYIPPNPPIPPYETGVHTEEPVGYTDSFDVHDFNNESFQDDNVDQFYDQAEVEHYIDDITYYPEVEYEGSHLSHAKRKNVKLIIILITIILLIVASSVGFGYIYYQDKQEHERIIQDNKDIAQQVSDQIDALGEITIDSASDIEEARDAYDSLTKEQKNYVENESTLVSAEAQIVSLKEAKAAEEARREEEERRAAAEAEARKSTLVVPPTTMYESAYVDANGGLNLRYGPGTNYNKILNIPNGSRVDVFSSNGSWYFVDYNGYQGWVAGEYLYADYY